MKKGKELSGIEEWRKEGNQDGDDGGMWQLPIGKVIASWGGGWDHVSFSREDYIPTYEQMEWVRTLFFHPNETVMQLSVPRSHHVNNHSKCLHWWRPQKQNIPVPPLWMVGNADLGILR